MSVLVAYTATHTYVAGSLASTHSFSISKPCIFPSSHTGNRANGFCVLSLVIPRFIIIYSFLYLAWRSDHDHGLL